MQLILLGLPGVGKGTQAKVLASHLGLLHISTGDMFRDAAEKRTSLGLSAPTKSRSCLLLFFLLTDKGNIISNKVP